MPAYAQHARTQSWHHLGVPSPSNTTLESCVVGGDLACALMVLVQLHGTEGRVDSVADALAVVERCLPVATDTPISSDGLRRLLPQEIAWVGLVCVDRDEQGAKPSVAIFSTQEPDRAFTIPTGVAVVAPALVISLAHGLSDYFVFTAEPLDAADEAEARTHADNAAALLAATDAAPGFELHFGTFFLPHLN